jgi:hypothetical protein
MSKALMPMVGARSAAHIKFLNDDGRAVIRTSEGDMAIVDAAGRNIVTPRGSFGIARTLVQTALPIGLPGPGSIGVNGALTLTAALQTTYSGGAYFYFPAGAVYAGSVAGFYYTVMSTTQAGTVYDNRLDGSGVPSVPSVPTPVVSGSIGAYVGTTSETTALTFVIPGGLLGPNGRLRHSYMATVPANTNNKTINVKWGASTIEQETVATAAVKMFSNVTDTINRGREDRQVNMTVNGYNIAYAASAANPSQQSVNTAVDVTATITLQTAVATDFMLLDGLSAEALPM